MPALLTPIPVPTPAPPTQPPTGQLGENDHSPLPPLHPASAPAPATVASRPPRVKLPSATTEGFVVTERHDSFWSISERVYGSGVYFRALYELNKATTPQPDDLHPGRRIDTPALAELQQKFPDYWPEPQWITSREP